MSIARQITSFSQNEIDQLFKRAQTCVKKKGLDIRLAPKASQLGKILIVIPRKAGNAPERNLLKRRLKSIFYEEQLFEKAFDWIVLAHSQEVNTILFIDLRTILLDAYQKAEAKRESSKE